MRQPSVIIHKGRKEERYELYVEDYVMSFLKEETGTLELSEFFFYGFRENENRRFIIYGVGRDKKLQVFDKYSLLEEIGCHLTQAGPVFYIKEENGRYEIKGYEVFYQDNKEMQSYLIERNKDTLGGVKNSKADIAVQSIYANRTNKQKTPKSKAPYSAISVQLSIILVALVAIVINSTNSYDKMKQLNQSASEVFFAIENQEAENVAEFGGGQNEIIVERNEAQDNLPQGDVPPDEPDIDAASDDSGQEEVLKLVTLENEEQTEEQKDEEISETEENAEPADTASTDEPAGSEEAQQEESQAEGPDEEEEVEALSRNVSRYYEIEKGDTLYTISWKIYGDTTHVQRICELNQITNPDNIRYGQKIILP